MFDYEVGISEGDSEQGSCNLQLSESEREVN